MNLVGPSSRSHTLQTLSESCLQPPLVSHAVVGQSAPELRCVGSRLILAFCHSTGVGRQPSSSSFFVRSQTQLPCLTEEFCLAMAFTWPLVVVVCQLFWKLLEFKELLTRASYLTRDVDFS